MQNKTKIKDILEESSNIDTKKVAREVLTWLIENVESFIDNQKREFKIDFILDSDKMSESTKLQNLYKAIPESDLKISLEDANDLTKTVDSLSKEDFKAVNKCRVSLDKITKKCLEDMRNNEELLSMLFKRMIFYYEMVGISKGNVLLKQLEGAVTITEFDYEAFSVGVTISSSKASIANENGEMETVDIGEEKNYTIPEGFSVWLEIAYKDTIQRPPLF